MEQDGIAQYETLIGHWLRQEPAEDMTVFARQAAQAVWLEKRHFETMSKIFGAKQ